MENTKRKDIIVVTVTFIYSLIVLIFIGWVNSIALNTPNFIVQNILFIVAWWPMIIPTVIFMRRDKENCQDIGFSKDKVLFQIIAGFLVAVGSLFIFIVLPALFKIQMGYVGEMSFIFVVIQMVNMLLAVALIEEIIFRGHILKKLNDITGSKWTAIIISSVLFGLFHIFNWSIIQIVFTTLIGFFYCVCRDKIKHCTLLSLIIAHSLHNSLLPIITALFFG